MTDEQSAAAQPVAAGPLGEQLRRVTTALTPLKRMLRSSEIVQIIACALLGVIVGCITAVLRDGVQFFHRVDFALSGSTLLSAGLGIDRFRIVVVPALGGLLLGVMALLTRRFRGGDIVDPVEANALYGGRMSLVDSIRLALATFVSNGSGASLGMEAGYTQLGSGIFSAVGGYFSLRRADRRIFVTAGAAAAIAAAFNAPLAGAFYGYELILGGYTLNALAPVAVAAVCGTLAQNALGGDQALFAVASAQHVDLRSYLIFGAMGVCAAGLGIVTMMCVTWTERVLRRVSVPDWLRPLAGGILLSAIALYDPQVLGSGHGGIQYHLDIQWPLLALVVLLFAKVIASGVSVGSGFRGGLFSSSLFIGCLFGGCCGFGGRVFRPVIRSAAPGLSACGHGVRCGGNRRCAVHDGFPRAGGDGRFSPHDRRADQRHHRVYDRAAHLRLFVLDVALPCARAGIARRARHRLDRRFERRPDDAIRSEGRREQHVARGASREIPAGQRQARVAVAPDGHYAGWIDMAAVHDPQFDDVVDDAAVADIVGPATILSFPSENVRTALARFEQSQSETLPVLSARADPVSSAT